MSKNYFENLDFDKIRKQVKFKNSIDKFYRLLNKSNKNE